MNLYKLKYAGLFRIWILTLLLSGFLMLFSACSGRPDIKKSDIFNHNQPQVRVRIINTQDTIQIRFKNDWTATLDSGKIITFGKEDTIDITAVRCGIKYQTGRLKDNAVCDSLIFTSVSPSGELEIRDVPYGTGWWWAGQETRIYEGVISVYPTSLGKPEVIVSLPLEEYLCGVVPYEIGGDSPPQALKAQAVAARSEAIMALRSDMYRGEHHDLTSDVECQVFSGNHRRTADSDRAVLETYGQILTEKGLPVNAYYASNCGGHSELISNVWPDRPAPGTYSSASVDSYEQKDLQLYTEQKVRDWIFSQPDVFCNPDSHIALPAWSRKNFRWQKKSTCDALTKLISGNNDMGKLLDIKAIKRGSSGRLIHARFIFEQDSLDVTGELAIRQMWQPALRSACFVVDQEGDDFILNGAGWGHGVGMCQSGAVAQALGGKDYISILQHYYKETELRAIYE